jgi:DNA-binding PadR family transcriptional regulator
MQLSDIHNFFQNPPPTYLNQELAVCYVLSILLKNDSYGTALIQHVEHDYSTYRLSDTVLYSALKFLEHEHIITGYWKKVEGRGRPRRMYQILPTAQTQAEEFAQFWHGYIAERQPSENKFSH